MAQGEADDDGDDVKSLLSTPTPTPTPPSSSSPVPRPPSPDAPTPKTVRTAHRVRFQLDDETHRDHQQAARHGAYEGPEWVDDEDYLTSPAHDARRDGAGHRVPLLTDIEAPSVTLASARHDDDDGGDFNPEDHLESARPKSGMKSAFMNMANSIMDHRSLPLVSNSNGLRRLILVSSSSSGQPYAFKQAGLVTGVALLIGLTVTVDWTIRLIVVNSKLSGANSFQGTMEACFGRPGLISISIAQWVFAFGGMVAFCIIVGDSIPHVLTALFPSLPNVPFLWLLTNRRAVIVIFIMGISYPLSLYRDIAKLAKASTLALVSMLVILTAVITQGVRVPSEMRGSFGTPLLTLNSGVFQAIGVISFDHNSLLIYGSLKKPTLDRFARVTHLSTAISMVACMVMALAGFLTFGDKTQGNILNNFPADNIVVNIARFCFGLNMLTTLPLEAFVCREVMTHYYFPDAPWQARRHVVFSTGLVVGATALSLLTCDLGAVFELIGATSACALAYILPPLCYLKLSSSSSSSSRSRNSSSDRRSWLSWKNWFSWKAGERLVAVLCVCFGVAVMLISVVQAVVKIIKKNHEEKDEEKDEDDEEEEEEE
ncbi:MAG: hypothetical protein M1815_003763 [Lichina confinis]|nr:MAG: hypothetical protein M1815_003763 [Lichina confinis]